MRHPVFIYLIVCALLFPGFCNEIDNSQNNNSTKPTCDSKNDLFSKQSKFLTGRIERRLLSYIEYIYQKLCSFFNEFENCI